MGKELLIILKFSFIWLGEGFSIITYYKKYYCVNTWPYDPDTQAGVEGSLVMNFKAYVK